MWTERPTKVTPGDTKVSAKCKQRDHKVDPTSDQRRLLNPNRSKGWIFIVRSDCGPEWRRGEGESTPPPDSNSETEEQMSLANKAAFIKGFTDLATISGQTRRAGTIRYASILGDEAFMGPSNPEQLAYFLVSGPANQDRPESPKDVSKRSLNKSPGLSPTVRQGVTQ